MTFESVAKANARAYLENMKTFLLILVLGSILAAALVGVLASFDASAMSLHGWVALWLGTVLSLAVGGGLMALVFYSARKGFDDRVHRDTQLDDPD